MKMLRRQMAIFHSSDFIVYHVLRFLRVSSFGRYAMENQLYTLLVRDSASDWATTLSKTSSKVK